MGLFDATSTSGMQYSPGVNALHDQIIGGAAGGMAPWFKAPTYSVAGRNDMQTQAANGASGLFGQGSDGSYGSQMARLFGNADTSVSLADIMSYSAPLSDALNERGQAQLDQSFSRSSADISNRQAANAAFSGSGSAAALERAALNDSMANASKDLSLANEATGYQVGAGLATGNTDRALSGLGMQLGALSAADASRLSALGFDAQALGLLGAFGDQRQQYDQAVADAPYTGASRWQPYVPGIQGQQTSSETPSWTQIGGNLLSSILPFF